MRLPKWSVVASGILLSLVVFPPLVALVIRAFCQGTESTQAIQGFAGSRQLMLLGRSLFISLMVAGLGTFLGILVGYVIAMQPRLQQRPLLVIMLIPLLIPPFIHALSWIMCFELFGRSFHGIFSTIAVQSLAFFPLAGLLTWAGLTQMCGTTTDAALLARSKMAVFWRIELPLIRPYLLTGFLLIALFSFSDYGVPSLFRVNTYPVVVFAQFAAYYDVGGAVAASWPYLLLPLAALLVWRASVSDRLFESHGLRREQPIRIGSCRARTWWSLLFVVLVGAGGVFPSAMQVMRAGGWQTYAAAWRTAHTQIGTSLLVAAAVATILILLSTMIVWGGRESGKTSRIFQEYVSLLPIAIPGTLFGVGMILLWNRPSTSLVHGTVLALCLLYVAMFIPFAVRSMMAGFQSIGKNLLDAAKLTDAPAGAKLIRIIGPMLAPSALVGWVLCFVLSLRELTGTLLVTPPGVETLGVRIYSLYHYGAGNLVAALSVFMISSMFFSF